MIDYRDNYMVRETNENCDIAISSALGDRKEQQDRAAYLFEKQDTLVVVCDGMGGHECGSVASNLAVESLLEQYALSAPFDDVHGFLLHSIDKTDRRIASLKKEDGSTCQAGTTIASILIRDKALFWATAGDSRIYIHRGNELVRVTKDHVYQVILDEKIKTGQISSADYERETVNGGALVSFLGIDGVPLIENNPTPLELKKDDIIVVMTDGLYKILPDTRIKEILESENDIHKILLGFEDSVSRTAKLQQIKRDNMTIALVKIK